MSKDALPSPPDVSGEWIEDFLLARNPTSWDQQGIDARQFSFATVLEQVSDSRIPKQLSPDDEDQTANSQAIFSPFHSILCSLGFDPILLELAVIQDNRATKGSAVSGISTNQRFASLLASCADPDRNNPTLLSAWDTSIRRITGSLDATMGSQSESAAIVPNPSTYEHVWLCLQLRDVAIAASTLRPGFCQWPNWPEEEGQDNLRYMGLAERGLLQQSHRLENTLATLPLSASITSTRPYPFELRQSQDPKLPILHLCRGLFFCLLSATPDGESEHVLTNHERLVGLLKASYLLVVPFRRQIEFPSLRGNHYEATKWGGEPGGCLFALVKPAPAVESTQCIEEQLARSAVRISWLLQQAALHEGDSRMQLDRDIVTRTQHILAKLPHATYQPMSTATTFFKQYRGDLKTFFESAGKASAFEKLSSNLARAQRSINCLDYLVRLDPQVSDPEKLSRKIDEVRKGSTDLIKVIAEVVEVFRESWTSRNVSWAEPSQSTSLVVEGNCTTWDMAIWLLLKNAGEESGSATVRLAYGEKKNDPNRFYLSISNCVQNSIDDRQLGRMESALRGEDVVFPAGGKPDGLGVGLKTVGRIIAAMELTALVKYNTAEKCITITIDSIRGV